MLLSIKETISSKNICTAIDYLAEAAENLDLRVSEKEDDSDGRDLCGLLGNDRLERSLHSIQKITLLDQY